MPAHGAMGLTAGEAYAPKSRAILADSTGVRRVVILHKVNGVGAYLVRTSVGARLTVPASQLSANGSRSEAEKVNETSAQHPL